MTNRVTTYPSAIARACAALDESPEFKDLPDGYLRVVVRIIKKIRLSQLKAPIYASRSTIAREAGKSVETVGRAIKWLEERGMIERQQIARRGLTGSMSPITPTDKLLEALTLTGVLPSEERSLELVNKAQLEQSPAALPATSPKPAAGHRFVRVGEHTLPQDLAFLHTDKKIPATGVLALMKIARTHGKRLSDVVAATLKYLSPLAGRELFAYLRQLCLTERDFAYCVSEMQKTHQDEQLKVLIERKSVELEGRALTTRDGGTSIRVLAGGLLEVFKDGVRRYGRIDRAFVEALAEGRLVPRALSTDHASGETALNQPFVAI